MKNKATSFLKQLINNIVTAIKSKSMVVKTKTNSLKTRLAIFNLLHNKKLVSSAINHKIHAIMGQDKNDNEVSSKQQNIDYSKALVLYKGDQKYETKENDDSYIDMYSPSFNESFIYEEGVDGDDQDEEIVNGTASVIDMVKGSKEDEGEEFSLEDEINHVADVFIKRFHRQMKMQKLESFKRYQEMLERSV
ncbi:cotton fiber protein [Rhynchospora pubera]|uniref:Cotton fiber protein n=1 Tax=Rhynchospora pubera TaxID=906938 RepID=A0AAV8D711_9POAL|nr:cotton fiber protein [Rhynchospora pubera]